MISTFFMLKLPKTSSVRTSSLSTKIRHSFKKNVYVLIGVLRRFRLLYKTTPYCFFLYTAGLAKYRTDTNSDAWDPQVTSGFERGNLSLRRKSKIFKVILHYFSVFWIFSKGVCFQQFNFRIFRMTVLKCPEFVSVSYSLVHQICTASRNET